MAWNYLRAQKITIMLQEPGPRPVVAFRTLDLSPKAGYEWLMHGVTTLKTRRVDQIRKHIFCCASCVVKFCHVFLKVSGCSLNFVASVSLYVVALHQCHLRRVELLMFSGCLQLVRPSASLYGVFVFVRLCGLEIVRSRFGAHGLSVRLFRNDVSVK